MTFTLPPGRFWTIPAMPNALAIVTIRALYPVSWTFPETSAVNLSIESNPLLYLYKAYRPEEYDPIYYFHGLSPVFDAFTSSSVITCYRPRIPESRLYHHVACCI
jgi:hypothetical protein